jgi:hypothetical protein
VARAEADEPLVGATVPLQREPQRGAVGLESQLDPIVGNELDPEPHVTAAVQRQRQFDARFRCGEDLGVACGLERCQLLVRDHALGQVDELIVHGALGDPGAAVAHQPASVASDREAERPRRDLHAQRTALQQQLLTVHSRGMFPAFGHSHPPIHQNVTPHPYICPPWSAI